MTTSKRSIILGLIIAVAAVSGILTSYAPMERAPDPVQVTSSAPVLVGTGDIADCDTNGDEATAQLLDKIDGTVFTTGDNIYGKGQGTLERYQECYEPSWGRHKARTRPAIGNHDYPKHDVPTDYFQYFGANAGEPGKGYYSYDLGAWHIIVLNSVCDKVDGGCKAGSPQEQWLRAQLAAHPTACTLAYWHHPRFSSGKKHGNDKDVQAFWDALYEAGVDVVINGHEHSYERFAPQDPKGRADPVRGIRQFVVGNGGKSLYDFDTPIENSKVRNNDTFGVLKLTLHPTSYDWEFIPVAGNTFTDSGSASCR
jgi:hypothetical protein